MIGEIKSLNSIAVMGDMLEMLKILFTEILLYSVKVCGSLCLDGLSSIIIDTTPD